MFPQFFLTLCSFHGEKKKIEDYNSGYSGYPLGGRLRLHAGTILETTGLV